MPASQTAKPIFDTVKAQALLKRARLSYAAVAARMGFKSRQTIGHWMRGRGEPDVRQLKDMADAIGCHWLELVTDETTVIWNKEEIERVARMRSLSPDSLAELDEFLAFKAARDSQKPR